jgi:hypothetical protein
MAIALDAQAIDDAQSGGLAALRAALCAPFW